MPERGPVPKRSDQRRRRNKEETPVTSAAGAAEVPIPKPNSKWHPIAKRWFTALAASGQSAFYEPSDWATAELIAESISRDLKPQIVGVNKDTGKPITWSPPITGASLSAYLKGMSSLLVTEGDRRRVRLELQRPKPDGDGGEEAGDVSWIDDARRRLREPG